MARLKSKKTSKKTAPSRESLKNLRPFEKGQSGNPGGRPKLPEDIKEARQHSNQEVERSIHRFFNMTTFECRATLLDPDTPVIDKLIGSIVAKAISSACFARASFLLDRAGCRLPANGSLIDINIELQNMSLVDLEALATEALDVLRGSPLILSTGVA